MKILNLLVWPGAAVTSLSAAMGAARPNILFISVDDLRTQLGCYGEAQMHTPAIDSLASRGLLFERAYCQEATCGPSRTSVLTGRRPDTTQIYRNKDAVAFRDKMPGIVTLPQYFKDHGYFCEGLGKVFHNGVDDPESWSVPQWAGPPEQWFDPAHVLWIEEHWPHFKLPPPDQQARDEVVGPVSVPWESYDTPEKDYRDAVVAQHAIDSLERLKQSSQPFFLAVGFWRPHLPFIAPKKYFDLYPLDSIRLPPNYFPPHGVPTLALTEFPELRNYLGIPRKGPLADLQGRELIRAYDAAASFADAQVGRVLDALKRLDLADNTIVVLWGDNGWHLGDNSLWAKLTDFEVAAHIPLILAGPGVVNGQKTASIVELVDLYPTLCDLAGLPLPRGLEGRSLQPLCTDLHASWPYAAYSQVPRGDGIMGYSMRTVRWRYTEWVPLNSLGRSNVIGRELYDLQNDPGSTVNLAAQPEWSELERELSHQMIQALTEQTPLPRETRGQSNPPS